MFKVGSLWFNSLVSLIKLKASLAIPEERKQNLAQKMKVKLTQLDVHVKLLLSLQHKPGSPLFNIFFLPTNFNTTS